MAEAGGNHPVLNFCFFFFKKKERRGINEGDFEKSRAKIPLGL
jgi:hypothetical protein